MSNATYVIVIEHNTSRRSWTIGPYHTRIKAESACSVAESSGIGLKAWIEPVIRPDEYLQAIEQAFKDESK